MNVAQVSIGLRYVIAIKRHMIQISSPLKVTRFFFFFLTIHRVGDQTLDLEFMLVSYTHTHVGNLQGDLKKCKCSTLCEILINTTIIK